MLLVSGSGQTPGAVVLATADDADVVWPGPVAPRRRGHGGAARGGDALRGGARGGRRPRERNLTEHPDGLGHPGGGGAVITANPTETARMLHRHAEEVGAEPLGAATDLARRTGAVVVHGGSDKTVVTPHGDAWLVEEGGAGLTVSGSGDVAAGIVAGLLGRGAEPAQAAVWGAWLHGCAGERLTAATGPVGFLARELPGQVPPLLVEAGD